MRTAGLLAWWFVVLGRGLIGPFATEAQCERMRLRFVIAHAPLTVWPLTQPCTSDEDSGGGGM